MRPYIYDYKLYREYLRDMIKWNSSQDKKYSLRWLSKRIGFSSPSMLSMSLSGQRILPLEKFTLLVDTLKLLPDESELIRLMYEMEHCEDPKELQRLQEQKKINFEGGSFLDITEQTAEVYSKWYLPALRELIALNDFRPDPFWMANKLGISPMEARDGMITLLRIGLASATGQKYERAIPSMQPSSPPAVVTEYTKTHIDRSKYIFGIDRNMRYANTLTLAVSKNALLHIPKILARLIAEVDTLAEKDPERVDVVQLNVQYYSMSEFAKLASKPPSN